MGFKEAIMRGCVVGSFVKMDLRMSEINITRVVGKMLR